MPMPKPKKDESKDDFTSRFMSDPVMVKEYPDEKQRLTICNEQWKKGNEMMTFNLQDVEIFEAGTWNGDKYTEDDLDEIVNSYAAIGNKIKPYLKLGHDNKQELVQRDGMPSAGWITGLKRVGKKLLADITGIPEKIYQLIESKAYGRVSSEIYWNLKEDGKKYSRVLKAVALLGADTPAVTSLNDFINLYTENDYEKLVLLNDKQEDNNMSDVEIKKYTDKIGDMETKLKEYELKIENAEKEKKSLKEIADKYEQQKIEMYSQQVNDYIDSAIKDGKITPAQRPQLMALAGMPDVKVYSYQDEKGDKKTIEKSSFELLKEYINSSGEVIPMGEKSKHVEVDKTGKSDDEIFDGRVKEYAKENKVSYGDAFDAIAMIDARGGK